MTLFSKQKKNIEINVAPLIDVVFLLLIFFMLASEFTDFKTIDMISPNQSNQEVPISNFPIIVNLSPQGIITIDKKTIKLQNLAKSINKKLQNTSEKKVIISTLNETKINLVVEIIDSIRSLGIENVALITKEIQ